MEATVFSSVPPTAVVPQFPASYQRGSQRITLPYLNRTIFIAVDDVLCLQGEGNYTFLFTRDRKKYLVSKTLKEFEKTLDGSIFLRIHKSYIVNLAYVQRSVFNKERHVQLADGREVAISRRRMKDISQQLTQFWQKLLN
ncbi:MULTISPECIES: LytR/AlgR family response regulator transcription factor [Spirosoma]|uniref:LytTR family transcriptional regulator n=1 Tax=Spirosoma liriopis TaxID=2937440 RepID=A0ABT0HEE9_9BACT|nr:MULTISPECIES: LytTR family DNA-binding domain-containing protein [Spirosoma]MCK8490532.1 LytTR family transcriptional regulator [Spirosoma liriopis]UHG89900.1 LytTR family transcriptional regulator [Spirosoma oryzicola]